MASPWIKVEHPTPHKPEILRLARLLNVSKDDAFGKVVRFWIWLDDVSVDGSVDGVVDADVDAVVSHIGFTRALQSVGWVELDDDGAFLGTPNFDRHNGETAKKRAEKAQRQKKWRERGASVDEPVDAGASTRAPTRGRGRDRSNKESASADSSTCVDATDETGHIQENGTLTPKWLLDAWNERAAEVGLKTARAMTRDRTAKARLRLKQPAWPEIFLEALDKLPVPNEGTFQWQPDLDWMIANETNALKIAEGKYDRRQQEAFF